MTLTLSKHIIITKITIFTKITLNCYNLPFCLKKHRLLSHYSLSDDEHQWNGCGHIHKEWKFGNNQLRGN